MNARLITNTGRRWRHRLPTVSVRLLVGRGDWIGAGYIGGATAWVFLDWPRVSVGATRNGNRAPVYPYASVSSRTRTLDLGR